MKSHAPCEQNPKLVREACGSERDAKRLLVTTFIHVGNDFQERSRELKVEAQEREVECILM